jgi:hypothetical protein
MARESRPPGFDMAYRPVRRMTFGPPLKQRLPALVYLVFALAVCAVIAYGNMAPSSSKVFVYVVEGDRNRMIPSTVCAIILFGSALAAVLREQMRGVIVHPDGIELRELLSLGLPRVRRFHWSQIDKMFVPSAVGGHDQRLDASLAPKPKNIRLDLWDGSMTWLPPVAKLTELGLILERLALARAIPVEGGTGLIDDLGNPLDD